MTRPGRFLFRMTLFLVVVFALAGVLWATIGQAFLANPWLNAMILGVFLIGVVINLRQVWLIGPEVAWIERFRLNEALVIAEGSKGLRLLVPMANMLRESQSRSRFVLTPQAMRSLLDGIASRLDEGREIARYFVGLSIFLGLLGTFYGLLQTVGAISSVISTLDVSGTGDAGSMFVNLKSGLEKPLGGMGTAFSASLLGLAGSLVLGFLDLQAGQAQNAFFNELEEWLSGITRLGSGLGGGDGDQSVPAYIQALLEQSAENMAELQRTLSRGEDSRSSAMAYQRDLIDRLSVLTDQMRAEQEVLMRMAEGQVELKAFLQKLSDATIRGGGGGLDDTARGHIRNMDVALTRLVDEATHGRDDAVKEIRAEIKLLARTIAARNEAPPPPAPPPTTPGRERW